MSEDHKLLLRRWFDEVWNQGKVETIHELFCESGIAHGLSKENDQPMIGPDGFKEFHRQFRDAFPDILVTVEDVIVEGDKAVARCKVSANHSGDGLGIAATNKPIEITGMSMVRIKDSQIVESWNNYDFLKLFQQIGAA